MDRGHGKILRDWQRVAVTLALLCVGGVLSTHAQTPTPTATPWVQAPAASPVPPVTDKLVSPPPSQPPGDDERPRREENSKRRMGEGKQRERNMRDGDARDEDEDRWRIEQLPAEEREAFQRNLKVWRSMASEDRQALRRQVDVRVREEIERALQDIGLPLDRDQRDVFALRYRQERRKLERELQEKMNAERARRLPKLIEQLRREFAVKAAKPSPSPAPSPAATPTASPAGDAAGKPKP